MKENWRVYGGWNKKRVQAKSPEPLNLLERKTRFELATPTLARLCSTPELLPRENYWWRDPELNWGHTDFQSVALPTELSRQVVLNGGADGT